MHCDLDLGYMTLGQGYDALLDHGHCIISISNMALGSYCPDPDFLCGLFVLGDMPLDQNDDIAFGHGKQSYEILSIPNMAVGSYGRKIETTRGHLHFMCEMSHFSSSLIKTS